MFLASRHRLRSASLVGVLLLIGSLLAGMLPPAASAAALQRVVFRATFDNAPTGPITTPLSVTVGTVESTTAPVAVVPRSSGGKALAIGAGTASAALRFPDTLARLLDPGTVPNSTYLLQVTGVFTASQVSTAGASFGVETDAGSFTELFSFGANGQLTRAGAELGAAYLAHQPVRMSARLNLINHTMSLALTSLAGGIELRNLALPASLTPASISQLRFKTTGTGSYALDDVEALAISLTPDKDTQPPANIIILPPVPELEFRDGIPFILLPIELENKGGRAKYVFLTIDRDDLLDLLDLNFLEGVGYVVEIKGNKVTIGLGLNNVVNRGGKVKLKLMFKHKGKARKFKVKLDIVLRFDDSDGPHILPFPIDRDFDLDNPPSPSPSPSPSASPSPSPSTSPSPSPSASPSPSPSASPSPSPSPSTMPLPSPSTKPLPVPPPTGVLPRLPIERIELRFRNHWQRRGGLPRFGLPLTEPVRLPSGIIVQYFERVRFEYHPELAGTEHEVLLGRLGVELGYSTPAVPAPATPDRWYFAPTGHLLATPFRNFWTVNGGLASFGYPIGEAFTDANGRQVQYFERARLEYHPERAGTLFAVMIGFLGEESLLTSQTAQP